MGLLVDDFRDERQMRGTIGVGIEEFNVLLGSISESLALQKSQYAQSMESQNFRQRKLGGGRKSKFVTSDNLCICLLYLKSYPKFDDLAYRFKISRSSVHKIIHKYLPLLQDSLLRLKKMPAREFESAEQLRIFFWGKRGLQDWLLLMQQNGDISDRKIKKSAMPFTVANKNILR